MQRYRLEKKPVQEIIRGLKNSLNVFPVIPRDCVKALNTLIYNMQSADFDPESAKEIIFLVLRGFTSDDHYLRNYIYTALIELGRRSRDGILAINCIVKDLDSRKIPAGMKNTALRALFSNLPPSMYFDFEKYVRASVLDRNDNGVVVAAEFFRDAKVPAGASSDIRDYHQAFFNRLPVNRYSCMLEMRRIVRKSPEEVSSFLFVSTEPTVFLEAAKELLALRPEIAAPHVEKAVHVLRTFLKKRDVEALAGLKVLSGLSASFPSKVARANREIEDLVQSPCRCISMLAILTLLKTGTEETVDKLALKLDPYMQSMSNGYKRMAIDAMEKLAAGRGAANSASYLGFLKKALAEKGDLAFKRYILAKFGALLRQCSGGSPGGEIIRFLCGYLEDPEYYQLNMDILGILGQHLEDPRDLVHIYNRLILENAHVRKAAIQALSDLSRRLGTGEDGFDPVAHNFKDAETQRLCDFLVSCRGLERGPFSLSELGDLRAEVAKYIDEEEEEEAGEEEQDFIKECRPVVLTPAGADFTISVVKKMSRDGALLVFAFESNLGKVKLDSGVLALDLDGTVHRIGLAGDDFAGGRSATKELAVGCREGLTANGVFEYQIYFDDDLDNDSVSLEPFNFSVFDYVRPAEVAACPVLRRGIEVFLDCKPSEAASRIVGTTNMFLAADKDNFRLSGLYDGSPVVIEASMSFHRATAVRMEICCDRQEVIDKIVEVFE